MNKLKLKLTGTFEIETYNKRIVKDRTEDTINLGSEVENNTVTIFCLDYSKLLDLKRDSLQRGTKIFYTISGSECVESFIQERNCLTIDFAVSEYEYLYEEDRLTVVATAYKDFKGSASFKSNLQKILSSDGWIGRFEEKPKVTYNTGDESSNMFIFDNSNTLKFQCR